MYIQRQDLILAGTENANVLAGNQFEFSPVRSIIEFGLVASATGLLVDILIGARAVIVGMQPNQANRVAIYPDDFPTRAGAIAGERIIIRVRNPTAGNLTLFSSVKFTPV